MWLLCDEVLQHVGHHQLQLLTGSLHPLEVVLHDVAAAGAGDGVVMEEQSRLLPRSLQRAELHLPVLRWQQPTDTVERTPPMATHHHMQQLCSTQLTAETTPHNHTSHNTTQHSEDSTPSQQTQGG